MSLAAPTKNRPLILQWLIGVDQILRGEATRPANIQQAEIKIPVVGISVIVILMAMIYGLCMGIFALVRGVENSEYQQALMQTFASMCKVPLLFVLTLVVTFPSLYVFNALVGSKLRGLPVLKLLVASLAVNLAVLASMGPILAFFSVSTPNYPFIVLLNVLVFTVAGILGLSFLVQSLNRLVLANRGELSADARRQRPIAQVDMEVVETTQELEQGSVPPQTGKLKKQILQPRSSKLPGSRTGPLDRLEGVVLGRHVRKVFTCWILVFGLVGAQMGWVLRPFVGAPGLPFQWFRPRESNFFEAVWNTMYLFLFG